MKLALNEVFSRKNGARINGIFHTLKLQSAGWYLQRKGMLFANLGKIRNLITSNIRMIEAIFEYVG